MIRSVLAGIAAAPLLATSLAALAARDAPGPAGPGEEHRARSRRLGRRLGMEARLRDADRARLRRPRRTRAAHIARGRRRCREAHRLALQQGPCILVAHSYGGTVITEAGNDPRVAGLVYIAAHEPDTAETQILRMASACRAPRRRRSRPRTAFPVSVPARPPRATSPPTCRTNRLSSRHALPDADGGRRVHHPGRRSRLEGEAEVGLRRRGRQDHRSRPRTDVREACAQPHGRGTEGASHSVYESHPSEVAALVEEAAETVRTTPRPGVSPR